ncbi:voltage-dependent calcium channel subunit alpha-2/delta-3 [Maniola hyperantus]|uniref:voltage-dependent calcium channel subunit alpha-2/delta-3 n=1 Tax=Aphantopus hyperantus TaxID=2795564 RepID=UPI0015695FC1|nr:voltage-dependent calcium channel subunit alpha-2/delta-3 [Maniola hyperantus]
MTQCYKIVIFFTLLLLPEPAPAWRSDTVKQWARTLGEELWRLSESLTKSDQIRIKYKQMNASVKKKDGKQILDSSLRSVSTMLTRKINAVKCIHATAERLAANFEFDKNKTDYTYCSAKYSQFYNETGGKIDRGDTIPKFATNNSHYKEVSLERDSHFYDINVNTSTSCIHVPTNIFYQEAAALNAILWSKKLNQVFINNYKSDPSLVWQYFGSAHGILRFYPGMPWKKEGVDTYDCRVKSWYIEAATCSKDVIVLFDVSGSMTGFKNYVARRTLDALLATLSNNDYVNVYKFNATTLEVVNCFKGLVQATPENVATITDALEPLEDGKKPKVKLEGNANLTTAYIKAFKTLKEERIRKQCNVSSPLGCNQLVMLITDYVPGNLTEVFEEHNREVIDNKTYIPVRVFTYLIGKEVTNVREIQWMACLNRGYFVHIHSVEEVQQQVLKYINVIARPMILEGDNPPPTWTHANIDHTRTASWGVSKDVKKPDEDKLVTSVAIPAFDYKSDQFRNNALLLGVAGTDVPIDSIAKLAQPHQLGVNGYSFIVSNNGYLLLHPLLITTINDELQKNYNSVDFVEVEQVDDGKGPRELGDKIKGLRENLVNASDGSMTEVEVLFHYDKMRRIARVKHDYFFNRLEGTPFSMGISLPMGYGDTELMLKDNPLEAKQGQELVGVNVTTYFDFAYRVHPDWVYCKYHYLEGHESQNSEIEIFKFLVNISRNEIDITKKQYGEEVQSVEFNVSQHCSTTPLGKDEYYCNEDLVKQLVFDAKLSTPYFRTWEASEEERSLAEKYNVNVRFIATSSGMTRWHYIFDDSKNEKVDTEGNRTKEYPGDVFGDFYYNAIEETWYKAAVLQHMIDKESLVIATNLPVLDKSIKSRPAITNTDGDIIVTASYAIFYKDGDSETPAAVVGFQYMFSNFQEIFFKMTESTEGDLKCDEYSNYDCYVIDSSGYVVMSRESTDVGKFFGSVGSGKHTQQVMQSFVDKKVFEYTEVFNYQALCPDSLLPEPNCAFSIDTPFRIATNFFKWLLVEAFLVILNIFNWNEYTYAASFQDMYDYVADDPETETDSYDSTTTNVPPLKNNSKLPESEKEKVFSCDHSITLYILNQLYFLNSMGLYPIVSEEKGGNCFPPYWASLVTKTNLLLVVVEKGTGTYEGCKEPPKIDPIPTPESVKSREPCHKLDLGRLPRRPLEGCYTYHDKERNITDCGLGSLTRANILTQICMILLVLLVSKLYS